MGEIVNIADAKNKVIDLQALQRSKVKSAAGLIAPAKEETHCELAPEHAAEPIKSLDDIYAISEFLISNKRYRDNMLFIVGINFGLRVSDLRMLRFSNLINDNFTFRDNFPVFEKKTRNTRKRKKNRYITINTAVIEAVTLYCVKGTSGWQIGLETIPGTYEVVDKDTFGYFSWQHILDKYVYVEGDGTRVIELCGLDTDICVITNALIIKTLYP